MTTTSSEVSRLSKETESQSQLRSISEKENNKDHNYRKRSTTAEAIALLGILVFSVFLCEVIEKIGRFSVQKLPDNLINAPSFVTENALKHIDVLGQKPKHVGSKSLENALQYIQKELEQIKQVAEQNEMTLDIDYFQSSANTHFIEVVMLHLTFSYDKVTSIVARLRPNKVSFKSPMKTLLVNAHVDSAIGSPGASDNICAVGLSLEAVRALASMPSTTNTLQRPIVFLFNGAEESILQGAHSFVSQHPWASTIAAFINLESIGSGDSYHLFRVGPGNPWLVDAYVNSVSRPVGSVMSTDVFNTGLIPAETDFRVFTDDGNIPGYDFALVDNGYIYHTIYDDIAHVDKNGVKHGGNTVIELALELTGKSDAIGRHENNIRPMTAFSKLASDLLGFLNSKAIDLSLSAEKVTFFDIGNRYVISYDGNVAVLLNIFVLTTTVLLWTAKFQRFSKTDILRSIYMIPVVLLSMVAALASSTFAGLVYSEALKAKLHWYGDKELARLMFEIPAWFGVVTALLYLLPRNLTSRRYEHMLFAISAIYFAAIALFTRKGLMVSYVPCFTLITLNFCALLGISTNTYFKQIGVLLTTGILGARSTSNTLRLMLPLLGRIRSQVVPHDVIAAGLVTVLSILQHIIPILPALCHFARGLRKLQSLLFISCIAGAAYISVVRPKLSNEQPFSPYSINAPKRIFAIHFHSPQQNPPSILYLATLDPIPMNFEELITQLNSSGIKASVVNETVSWGKLKSSPLESIGPFQKFLQSESVISIEDAPSFDLPALEVISEEETKNGHNLTIRTIGRDAHGLSLRFSIEESGIIDWSIKADLLDDDGSVRIRHIGSEQMTFWIIVSRDEGAEFRKKVVISVSSIRLGASRSKTGLSKLNFGKNIAPVLAVSTGYEFEV